MKTRTFKHKYKQVVTDRFVLTLEDKREDAPKSKRSIAISGMFRETTNMEVNAAYELRDALNMLLRGVPKTPEYSQREAVAKLEEAE